mmetsp:Transcript_29045/g.51969  ORF Transcript_29045/g.51969 Transcript_29045/m.51969 type:complete len:294 (-) Transcript_29045:1717-2598(-)
MGSTPCSGSFILPLDCNIFQQGSVSINSRVLDTTEKLQRYIASLVKPCITQTDLKLIISTKNSRLPLEARTLLEVIQSAVEFKISARLHEKVTLVVDYLRDGKLAGETTLFADVNDTFGMIRHRVSSVFHATDTVLYTSTMILEDKLSLFECGILEDIRLFMMPACEPTISLTACCPNLSAWRLLKSGMNLEGICQNSSCPAYSQRVVVPLGFGTFNIAEEMISHHECPICNEVVSSFSNLGFYNCSAKFDSSKGSAIRADGIECSNQTYSRTKVERWRSAVVAVTHRKLYSV